MGINVTISEECLKELTTERDRFKAFLEHIYEGDGNVDFDELYLALYGKQPE
jgi:hypothetical protein